MVEYAINGCSYIIICVLTEYSLSTLILCVCLCGVHTWLCLLCLGLSNPEEFSFTSDEQTQEQILRRAGHQARDQKKLHTDEERKQQILMLHVLLLL